MNTTRLTVAVALVVAPFGAAFAADAPPGASSCSGCHAKAGVETPVPRLEGRPAADIVAQMEAFKSGQKTATVMDRLAKGFNEAEVQAIAAWYAQQK